MPGYKLLAENLDWSFKNMTLVVSVCRCLRQYEKPEFVLQKESRMREEFKKMNAKNPREGEVECTYQ